MSDLPATVGKYKITASLGEGAMGIVYKGFDPDIERRVAIKVLHPDLVRKKNAEEFMQRFKREAQSAARCTHPNVVTVLEYGQDGEMPYIVMEFVEGASLQEILKRRRPLSLQKTLSIISQLLKALHSAHQLNIVHRDIKSGNVMILKDGGAVKLADFGIARIAGGPDLTMTGAVVGTPKYMSPEQMFGLKVDARADLFSVAMVFVELLSYLPSNLPIPCSELPEIVNLPPNNRIDYSILYPTALIPVITKGLAVKPDERYQSAREFMQAIKDVLPQLKAKDMAAAAEEATAVVQESTQSYPPTQDELDSMTRLLVEYVGPVAKNIMIAHNAEHTAIDELASEISREIPTAEEREAFLRRWENISGTRIDTSRVTGTGTGTGSAAAESFDEELLEKMGADYAIYMGPMAARLVKHYSASSSDLQQLVESLASEIPDAGDSQKFRETWL